MNYYGYEFIRESDLTHHGIKGQKWGIRRYQNEDGSWTAAGRERYGGSVNDVASAKAAYKAAKKDYNKSFNNAYYHNHPYSFSKKKREETQQRWNDASDKARKLGEAKRAYKDAQKNDPAHQKRVANLKKAAKIGAAVAGTALVAYGAYKLNGKLNDNIRKEYLNKGSEWVRKSGELTRIANESVKNLKRDTDNFKSSPAWRDPVNSKYTEAYLRGLELRGQHVKQQLTSAVAARSRATQYYEKAKQDTYSLAEKRDALKRMIRHK